MIVKINNIDYSNKVITPSFKITKNSNYQNDLSFDLKSDDLTFQGGMEVIVYEDDGVTIIFGGLIQQPIKKPKNKNVLVQTMKSLGYRQILARRSVSVDYTDTNAGVIVEDIYDANLDSASLVGEGFSKGTIDAGIEIPKKSGVFSIFKLYSDLAQSSGLGLWVTDTKEFNFTRNPTYTTITKKLSDFSTDLDKFKVTNYPVYKEDLSKYRNKQFVIGKTSLGNDVIGSAENTVEISRMQSLYGSGVYGNIINNNDIRFQADADDAAKAELDAYTSPPATITYNTTDEVDVNQRLLVNLSLYGINDVYYIVDKIQIKFDRTENQLIRTVSLKEHIVTAKAVTTWTDDWNDSLRSDKYAGEGLTEETVHVYGNTNPLAFTSVASQVLPGVSIDYNADTKVGFNATITATTTLATILKLSVRVGGVVKYVTYKTYTDAIKDQINFTGFLDNLGNREIDFLLEIDSGSSGLFSIASEEFNVNFVVQYGIEYIPPPAPIEMYDSVVDSFNPIRHIITLEDDNHILANLSTPGATVVRESTDGGVTWSTLFTMDMISIIAYTSTLVHTGGTTAVYLFMGSTPSSTMFALPFDTTVISGAILPTDPSVVTIDSALLGLEEGIFGVYDGSDLHITYTGRINANGRQNISYCVSSDKGATWATPQRVTSFDVSNRFARSKDITINGNGDPVIIGTFSDTASSSAYKIQSIVKTTVWTENLILNSFLIDGFYREISTGYCTTLSGGTISVAFGLNSDAYYSQSTDGGSTWSTPINLTNTVTTDGAVSRTVMIGSDSNDNEFVIYSEEVAGDLNIRMLYGSNGSFSDYGLITNNTTGYADDPRIPQRLKGSAVFPPTVFTDFEANNMKYFNIK